MTLKYAATTTIEKGALSLYSAAITSFISRISLIPRRPSRKDKKCFLRRYVSQEHIPHRGNVNGGKSQ